MFKSFTKSLWCRTLSLCFRYVIHNCCNFSIGLHRVERKDEYQLPFQRCPLLRPQEKAMKAVQARKGPTMWHSPDVDHSEIPWKLLQRYETIKGCKTYKNMIKNIYKLWPKTPCVCRYGRVVKAADSNQSKLLPWVVPSSALCARRFKSYWRRFLFTIFSSNLDDTVNPSHILERVGTRFLASTVPESIPSIDRCHAVCSITNV